MIKWTSVSIVSLASFCVWSQWPLGPCLLPFSAFNNGFVLSAGECPGGCKLAADILPNKCFKTVAQTEKCGTGEMLCFATHVLMGPALCSICNALFKWQVLPTPKQHLLSHLPPVPFANLHLSTPLHNTVWLLACLLAQRFCFLESCTHSHKCQLKHWGAPPAAHTADAFWLLRLVFACPTTIRHAA